MKLKENNIVKTKWFKIYVQYWCGHFGLCIDYYRNNYHNISLVLPFIVLSIEIPISKKPYIDPNFEIKIAPNEHDIINAIKNQLKDKGFNPK